MKRKELLWIVVTLIVLMAILYFTGMGCLILKLTGIPCFGCGMTRACISLMQFDISMAWYYHPLSFLLPFLLVALLFAKKMPKWLIKVIVIVVVILFIVVYFVRLSDPENEIVKWHVENGMIYKFIHRLLQSIKR